MAQDLKVAMDAVQLINNYFDPFELIMIAVGIVAVVVWIISMWRRGGQYTGKLRRLAGSDRYRSQLRSISDRQPDCTGSACSI